MRHNWANSRSAGQAIDQPPQFDQVGEPERRPTRGHRDERVRLGGIGPAHRQRELPSILVEEEHPILRPRLPDRHKHKLAAEPRMKWMRHTDSSLITDRIKRS